MRLAASWLKIASLVAGALMVFALYKYAYVEGDTELLIGDAGALLRCLRKASSGTCIEGGKFPPFQLLIAALTLRLGVSEAGVGILLANLSIAAYLGLLWISWQVVAARSRIVAWAVLLILGSGELLHYANHSFVEMQAAFLLTAFVVSWLDGKAFFVGLTAFLAALTKEPAALFLGLIALACVFVRYQWHRERSRLRWAGGGITLALLATVALNEFRFGKPYNSLYLEYVQLGPDLVTRARVSLALWASPNGGWLFFWPAFVALLAAVPIASHRYRIDRTWKEWVPFGASVSVLLLQTVFLSSWWAPFGWWAWGQRLMLPWLPAVLVVVAFAYASDLESLARRTLTSPVRAVILTGIAVLLALPHVASVFRGNVLIGEAFQNRPDCDRPVLIEPGTIGRYYRCLEAEAWTDPSPLVHGYQETLHPFVRGRALLWTVLLCCTGIAWQRSLKQEIPRRPSSGTG